MDHIYPANSNEKDPLKSIKAASKATDNIEVEEDLANPEKQPVIRPRPQRKLEGPTMVSVRYLAWPLVQSIVLMMNITSTVPS